MRMGLVGAVAASLVILVGLPAAAAKPTGLYVFGDSLVDAGNLDAAIGDVFNPPSAGYFPGRFTNGPVYTDLLNRALFGAYMTPSLLGGSNYAFAGARAADIGLPVPALDQQIGAFALDHPGGADSNALYVLNIGANDVFGLENNDIGGLTPAAYAADVLASITGGVAALDALGARHILVAGIPVIDGVGTPLNAALQTALDALQPSLHGPLLRLDYQTLFTQIVTDPAAFGLGPSLDITTPCMSVRPVIGGHVDCRGYFFFDDIHPTAEVQRAIFGEVLAVTGIPEPASWALSVLGFIGVGTSLRRRRSGHPGAASI